MAVLGSGLGSSAGATEMDELDRPEEVAELPSAPPPAASLSLRARLRADTQIPPVPALRFRLLESDVEPGMQRTLSWSKHVSGFNFDAPVIVVHGRSAGPTICLTAAVHGDELNGIEIARRVSYSLDPDTLHGTIVAVPIANVEGFFKQSRYVADRRDLNRYFPGDANGSAPARLAHSLFTQIVEACDALIDIHTGSYYRSNLPQLRADLSNDDIAEMAEAFGGLTVLHSDGTAGMLRVAATDIGIPSVTLEIGGPLRLEPKAVALGTAAIRSFLAALQMVEERPADNGQQATFYESDWLRADAAGIFISDVDLGDAVAAGNVLGRIVDPVSNDQAAVEAPYDGTVLGLADNQFVSPGYAIYRIGFRMSDDELQREAVERKLESAAGRIREGIRALEQMEEMAEELE